MKDRLAGELLEAFEQRVDRMGPTFERGHGPVGRWCGELHGSG